MIAARLALAGAVALGGCARPYAGAKTLAAIGLGLMAGGSASWIAGQRTGHGELITPGVVTAAVGAGLMIGAGGWLTATIHCQTDPDCPEGESCREVPAPPGGIPYRQCVRR
jgi:hypothetical protein